MHKLILIMMVCVLSLTGCASKVPLAYCPYPPALSTLVVDSILNGASPEGNIFLNKYKKHNCKFFRVYDPGRYENMCE